MLAFWRWTLHILGPMPEVATEKYTALKPHVQINNVPWWMLWGHVEALIRAPLTVPQSGGCHPMVLPPVPGFLGGFCSTMEVSQTSSNAVTVLR